MREIWPTSTVSRDDAVFEAFPDLLLHDGTLYCSYLVTDRHQVSKRDGSRIALRTSTDAGLTWSDETTIAEESETSDYTLNTSALGVHDGALFILIDRITKEDSGRTADLGQYIERHDLIDGGWQYHGGTLRQGMIPSNPVQVDGRVYTICQRDRLTHQGRVCGNVLYDITGDGADALPSVPGRVLCEGSMVLLRDGVIGAVFREDSGLGHPAHKMIISVSGLDDPSVVRVGETTLQGCHRPRIGRLDDERLLITYRYLGPNTRDRNTFGAVVRYAGFVGVDPLREYPDVFPIHCDTAPITESTPDQGYTAWAVVGDELLVANYIINDAPKAHVVMHRVPMDYVLQRGTLGAGQTAHAGSPGIAKERGE